MTTIHAGPDVLIRAGERSIAKGVGVCAQESYRLHTITHLPKSIVMGTSPDAEASLLFLFSGSWR